MRWRRRNARLRLEEDVDVNSETVCEIRPRIVISHDLLAFEWRHGRAPFLQLRVDGGLELFVVRLVECCVRRIESGKRLGNMLRNRLRDDRIDSEMRITKRMHVTRSARHICRHVHEANSL